MEHHEAVRTLAAERYLLREMADEERDAFEAHFFDCPACAESVRMGEVVGAAAEAGAARATAPAPATVRRFSPLAVFAPLAAAAVLAIVAGYQALVVIPALQGTRAFVPIALAPTSRGEGTVVPVDRTAEDIALSLDINIAPPIPRQLVYDLRTDAGDVVLTDATSVPPLVNALVVVVPRNSLTVGQYVIVVRDGSDPNREVGTYRIRVR